MMAALQGHWAQSEAIVMDDADTFIPYSKKQQAETPTVSTAAATSFASEIDDAELPERKGNLYVGACSSGVAFPSPVALYPPAVTKAAQEKPRIAGASSAGVAFPSPFAAPEKRPGSTAVPPSDAPCIASSSAGVAFPSPFTKASSSAISVVPLQGGLAGAAGSGVNFPSPFKSAGAPGVSVPFSSIQVGPYLAGCSSAGVSFPSPLVSIFA
jgi:hypothetical protein